MCAADEVEFMRSQLFLEKWEDDPLLPDGWKVRSRETSKNIKEFLSKEVTMFKSYRKALEYMKSYLTEKDVDKFEKFAQENTKLSRNTIYEFVEDASLPKGWKIRHSEQKVFIISPTNEQFTVRRLALKFMMDNNYPEDEIEFMRKHLREDKWEDHPLLPFGWKVKSQEVKSNCKHFLTRDCIYFKSYKSAIEHVKSSNSFSQSDLTNLEEFAVEQSRKSRGANYNWQNDESLPHGWKIRQHPGPKEKKFYLAPNGDSFPAKRNVLKFMVDNEMKDKDIEKIREGLIEEGWHSHKLLPNDWKVKSANSEKNSKKFLTKNVTMIHGFKQASQYIKNHLTSTDLERFEEYSAEESNTTRSEHYVWLEDEYLPSGWKMRSGDGIKEREFFLAPNLTQFTSRRSAYQHMIQEGYSEEDLGRMRQSMVDSVTPGMSWEVSRYLPADWLYRETSSSGFEGKNIHASVHILTVEGQLFKSYKTAQDFMEDPSTKYRTEDVENLKALIISKCDMRRTVLNDWKPSNTLPEGWMLRTGTGKEERTFVLSPDKQQYSSRKNALQHMLKNDFPKIKIQEMRGCLKHETFETSENLPVTWFFKISSSDIHGQHKMFLTTNGEEIKSFSKALEYMMMNDGYSDEDMDKLQKFIEEKTVQKRLNSDDWVKDETVPEGWMSRISEASGKQYFLGPDGEEFPSRRLALQHMITEGFPREEVETMRLLLQLEGWQTRDGLPEGWMYRGQSSTDDSGTKLTTSSIFILAEDGTMFDSFKKASNYMEQSDKFDDDDILNINDFAAQLTEDKKMVKTDWKEVNSLPRGWKVKNTGAKQVFVSPTDEIFPNRRVALKFMIDTNYPKSDVEHMKASLKLESWKEDPMLPTDWMFKKVGKDVHFLSREGDMLIGFQNAKTYLMSNDEYDPDDFDGFNMFTDSLSVRTSMTKYIWNEMDQTIPEGWKSRLTGSKTFFLSPKGLSFSSRRAAFQHMIKQDTDKGEAEEMKMHLSHEGWEMSPLLPEGWLHKHRDGKVTGSHNQLLTMEGNHIESYRLAFEYMKSLSYYTEKDLDGMRALMEEKSAAKRLSNLSEWSTSPTLPTRWKIKNSGQTQKEFFLGPDGRQFPCRKAALQHMIKEKYPAMEVEEMRQCLRHEGWETNRNLPKDWRIRSKGSSQKKNDGYTFLSTDGDEFKSAVRAVEHMKDNPDLYDDYEIEALKVFLEECSVLGRMSNFEWERDETVPSGWKSRLSGQRTLFLSPDGKGFPCRRAAYQHMIQESYPEEEVEDMRKLLRHENYEIHSHLPAGWRIRYTNAKAMSILSSEGQEFKSFLKTQEYLQSTNKYSESHLDDLKLLCEEKATERRQGDASWEEDPSVPGGWKMRVTVDGKKNEKEFFLAPDGRQFTGRRVALKTMIEDGFPEDSINEMRSKLVYEGWQTATSLPQHWYVKYPEGRCNKSHQFVTDTGDRLPSIKAALDFLQARPECDVEDVERLLKLTNTASEREVKQEWEEDPTLPEGWFVRRLDSKDSSEELEIFLTPSGQQLFTRRVALEHLVREGSSREEVARMRQGLDRLGWQQDFSLPPGFLRKTSSDDRTKVEFLTPDYQKMEGPARLLEYLLGQGCYPQAITQSVAKMVNWAKLSTARRAQLQASLDRQATEEGGAL